MTLGERIAHYRKQQRLSQELLSQQLGVSRQSVSKWERDESMPEAEKLPHLAKALGVSLDLLLTGEEGEAPKPAEPYPVRSGSFGKIRWLFRRWGWIGGLILAAYGVAVLGVGVLARTIMGMMMPPMAWVGEGYKPFMPMQIITTVILAVGGVIIVAGLVAALILYRKRPGKKS